VTLCPQTDIVLTLPHPYGCLRLIGKFYSHPRSKNVKAPQIVLIEDNPADVLVVEMALKESGATYEITKFTSGLEALRVLCPPEGAETSASIPDAILLDLNTPGSDGFQVLINLKQSPRLARVPVAIITSSLATSDRHRAGLLGARYIQKPALLDEFLTTIGKAVEEMIAEGRASKRP
jgi:two-component system, chemotaxis family, response regulator Rcp1